MSLYLLPLLALAAPEPVEITVTAARPTQSPSEALRQRTADVAGATALVDESAWGQQRATTLKDMVDFTPGVLAQPRNGAESLRLSIRGSGLTRTFQGRGLLLLQDGVPLNTADGGFEFNTLDPWLIRQMQILKGANALEQGATQLGGSINLITPTGRTQPHTRLRLEGGSFNHVHALISTGYATPTQDGFIALTYLSQDGFRHHNQQESTRLNASFGWQSNAHLEHRLSGSLSLADAQIPGSVSLADISRDARTANPANIAGRFYRDVDLGRVAYNGLYTNGLSEWSLTAFASHRRLDTPVTVAIKSRSNESGLRLRYGYGLRPNRFTTGLNAYYGKEKERRYVNAGGTPTTPIVTRDLTALTFEAYAQYEHLIAPFTTAIAGLQAASVSRRIDEHFPSTERRTSRYSALSPRVGLRYDGQGYTLFTNFSRSYEPPALSELSGGNGPGFRDLGDQSATTGEIGGRGQYKSLRWEAAAYLSTLSGEYIILRQPDGSSSAVNADRTHHAGLELGLGGQINRHLSLNTAYTYNHFRFRNDPAYGDNQLPGVPAHYLRAELSYHIGNVTLSPNVEWSPQAYYIDMANSLESPAYTVWNLRANWSPADKPFSLYADLRNLNDETYVATTNVIANAFGNDGRHFYPGEGRALYIGLSFR
ncbi:MAG: TonB-dependent receptor [Asticcacaulis sp.]